MPLNRRNSFDLRTEGLACRLVLVGLTTDNRVCNQRNFLPRCLHSLPLHISYSAEMSRKTSSGITAAGFRAQNHHRSSVFRNVLESDIGPAFLGPRPTISFYLINIKERRSIEENSSHDLILSVTYFSSIPRKSSFYLLKSVLGPNAILAANRL